MGLLLRLEGFALVRCTSGDASWLSWGKLCGRGDVVGFTKFPSGHFNTTLNIGRAIRFLGVHSAGRLCAPIMALS